MEIGGHLEGGPHIVPADHAAIQHLVGMEHRGHHVVDGHTVKHGVGIRALVLALPNHHHPRQIRVFLLGGEYLLPVRLHTPGQLGQMGGDPDGDQPDVVIVFHGGLALVQVVYDHQVVGLGEGGVVRIVTGKLDDRVPGIQQAAGGVGFIPGQSGAFHNGKTGKHVGNAPSYRVGRAEKDGILYALPRHLDHGGNGIQHMDDAGVFAGVGDLQMEAPHGLEKVRC